MKRCYFLICLIFALWPKFWKRIQSNKIRAIPKFLFESFRNILYQSEKKLEFRSMEIGSKSIWLNTIQRLEYEWIRMNLSSIWSKPNVHYDLGFVQIKNSVYINSSSNWFGFIRIQVAESYSARLILNRFPSNKIQDVFLLVKNNSEINFEITLIRLN